MLTPDESSQKKDIDWHEALVLSVMLLMLPTRNCFQRHSSLLRMSFSNSWLFAITLVLPGFIWLGFYASFVSNKRLISGGWQGVFSK